MDAIKTAFLRVKEDMDKMRREIEQIKDIQGVILDKVGVEAAALDIEEMDEDSDDDEDSEEDEDSNDDEDSEEDEDSDDDEDSEEDEDSDDDEDSEEDEDSDDDEDSEDDTEEEEETSSAIEGNFIATKTGKRYHIQSCNLVKNIAEKNKLMFDSKEAAEKEGLLMCHCVKKADN